MKKPAIVTMALAALCLPLDARSTTITGTDGGNNSWNTATNWSPGVPTGSIDAIVGSGVVAKVDSTSTPAYDGSLLLDTNAQLQVGWTTNTAANTNVLGTGPITMRQGSVIISRAGLGTYTFTQPFAMEGDATIWAGISTSNHNTRPPHSPQPAGPCRRTDRNAVSARPPQLPPQPDRRQHACRKTDE